MDSKIAQDTLTATEFTRDIDSDARTLDGSYAFVKNGEIVVQHDKFGPYPIVVPCPSIRLIVNDKVCFQAAPISMEDKVQLVVQDERKEGEWSIGISADGLQATLKICPHIIIHRDIKDLPPASKLELEVTEQEEHLTPFSMEELLQGIANLGITYGIDWQACSAGASSRSEEEIVIARGTPPQPGKDGMVELLFSTESKLAIEVDDDERIDYRNRFLYISISEGEILANKQWPESGIPGTSVTGGTIEVPPPRDTILSAGEGVVLDKNGDHAVAVYAGRPTAYRSRGIVKVSIIPELICKGDAGLASGNILFKGDVVIGGNVEDGTVVESGGNIRIGGLVSGAKIQARESVLIKKNILSSTVTAGQRPDYLEAILTQVNLLATGLQEMLLAVQQIIGHPTLKKGALKYDAGVMLKLLLEGKFHYLLASAVLLSKQADLLPQGLAKEGLDLLINNIGRVLKTPLQVHNIKDVEELANSILEWERSFAFQATENSDVVAANILNSIVTASGNIKVEGGGCYNSHIQAGKKVVIIGVFRGGQIQALGDVYIGEFGSRGGTSSRVMVSPKAKISVKNAYENSIVVIGNRTYRFTGNEKNVRLWVDAEDNLQLRTLQSYELDHLA